jgi:hypothetical protein
MNNYVKIADYKYKTVGNEWTPVNSVPTQIRQTLSGRTDIVFGVAGRAAYEGMVIVPVAAPTGFGCIDNFRTAYRASAISAFEDHYGNAMNIAFVGTISEKSLINMWDADSNEFRIPVTLLVIT